MNPAVSVVIRVYNGERHLREALDCALAQTFDDFEIVVIDDGSTDGSAAILAACDDPRLRVIRQPNGGKIAAAMRGLHEARGRYVAILDADDRCAPDRLARQAAFVAARPDVVLLGTALAVIDERGERIGVRRYPLDDAELRRAAVVYNPFAHSSLMMHRETALAVGGYSHKVVVEDYDLNLRMMRAGRCANLPQVLAEYRIRTEAVDTKLVKVVLKSTIHARSVAHREYGFPRTLRSTAVDAAQRALCLTPGAFVNWLTVRAFYRGA
jgi:glycosyltransferase involved in cell wall biosynthesis